MPGVRVRWPRSNRHVDQGHRPPGQTPPDGGSGAAAEGLEKAHRSPKRSQTLTPVSVLRHSPGIRWLLRILRTMDERRCEGSLTLHLMSTRSRLAPLHSPSPTSLPG